MTDRIRCLTRNRDAIGDYLDAVLALRAPRQAPIPRTHGGFPATGLAYSPDRVSDVTISARCLSELSRWSESNGGNWICSRRNCGTADQS